MSPAEANDRGPTFLAEKLFTDRNEKITHTRIIIIFHVQNLKNDKFMLFAHTLLPHSLLQKMFAAQT